MATPAENLADVDAAIAAVLKAGQSYTLRDGTTVTRASLDKLQLLRNQYRSEVAAAANSGASYRRVGFGGVA